MAANTNGGFSNNNVYMNMLIVFLIANVIALLIVIQIIPNASFWDIFWSNSPTIMTSIANSENMTILLLWTPFFGDSKWGQKSLGRLCGECFVTDDKTLLDQADVVLFHCRDTIREKQILIQKRQPRQMFVVLCHESPTHSSFSDVDSVGMNATTTYRLDSSVPLPYGQIVHKVNQSSVERYTPFVPWNSKTKQAVWMVSNCQPPSRRDLLVKEMSKYIDIDIFGSCARQRCKESRNQCLLNFAKTYKFYLSFENSICKDYVTEKFFNVLNTELIPVVYGGANYTKHVPRTSYINVRDFTTPKKLAEYLKWVGSNKTEYYKYFEWKRFQNLDSLRKPPVCIICEAARTGKLSRIAQPLDDWWKTNACNDAYTHQWTKQW
jgi:alpha-1,3-fucosyltransferase